MTTTTRPPSPPAPAPALKRRQRAHVPRSTGYFTPSTSPDRPLSALLDAWAVRAPAVLYLVCGTSSDDAPRPDYYREPVQHGWTLTYRHDVPARRVAIYAREGKRIDVRHSPAWWDGCTDRALLTQAHVALSRRLVQTFAQPNQPPPPGLLGSPAQTGLDLLDRSLPFSREYPVLPQEERTLLHANSPQARIEVYPHVGRMPAFYYYDARFAYAGCLRHLPCQYQGQRQTWPRHNGTYLEHTPAWYCVVARVPRDWDRVGLLPCKRDSDDPESGWEWPREPGRAFLTWVTGMEYDLAREHGWSLRIAERLSFAHIDTPGCDPLGSWAKKLTAMWQHSTLANPHEDIDDLHAAALRNITLHTIGAFARRDTVQHLLIPESDYLFNPFEPPKTVPGYGYEVERHAAISPEMARYDHPEWAAWVWAKQRVRLTRELLRFPFDALAGCNTDAYYTSVEDEHDDGKIGDYRLKGAIREPRAWPHTPHALHALKQESERH